MVTLSPSLPPRRSELVIRPLGERGRYVVKDPRSGAYFQLGQQEHFLLMQLDGQHAADAVCRAFEAQFAEPLSPADLEGFLAIARRKGLLESAEPETPGPVAAPQAAPRTPQFKQSLLYWRKSFWDPDRCFTWLAPKIPFFWTPGFVAIAACSIAVAGLLLVTNGAAVTASLVDSLRWESVAIAWLTLFAVTMLHESAHGLTCKRFGGEVHEIGFLLMFFMPCFYCNVSDAWLFREKSRRLWVTFAGGFFELFLWSLAVFAWRLTLPGTLLNYLAFIVLSACGIQSLFNFNPLLKLDGYYLLSDWLEIPNLRQRSIGFVMAHLRRLLWGASRPAPESRPLLLLGYGLLSWTYSLTFLCLMLWGLARLLGTRWGIVGWGAGGTLAVMSLHNMFRGLSAGELTNMIRTRYARTGLWGIGLVSLMAGGFVPIDDWATGEFQVRPTTRLELRAPLAAFIAEVHVDEGDDVSSGQCIVRLAIPDLETRIAQKAAEVQESQARLRLLETGPRPEEIAEQRLRVQRGKQWRNLADEDLQHAREALTADLARLDYALDESRAELEAARKRFQRDEALAAKGAVTKDRLEEAERALRVAQAKVEQRQAEQRARRAEGARVAAAELSRRSKELADEEGRLALLEAGTRTDEIEAERSRLGRLAEEERYLVSLRDKLAVKSCVAGIVTTPHLMERVGQFVHEGDSLCVIEQASTLVAEIALDEQQHSRVSANQQVQLRFRALPFQTFAGHVERIAPAAVKEATMAQGRFTVYCRLDGDTADLRQGMSGYARISTGRQPIGAIATDRALRLLRTEFWW